MFKSYKVEIKPTIEQAEKIRKTIGVCRVVYNLYLQHNKERYDRGEKFIGAWEYKKWFNNDFIPNHPEYKWIKEVPSKAVQNAMSNAEITFKKFFKKQGGYPRFKKKKNENTKIYLPKNSKTDFKIERHKAKIPCFSWICLKEFGYVPLNNDVRSCSISFKAGKYYISFLMKNDEEIIINHNKSSPIGIDLGIKDLAITSDKRVYKNINKTNKVRKLEKKLKYQQRLLSHKYESKKRDNSDKTRYKNIDKNLLKVQKLHVQLTNIRREYIKTVVNDLVRTNPEYIAIEDLNVKGMMKNRCLSKAIQKQNFYYFRLFMIQQCHKHNIELRIIYRFYPSSKLCSNCGHKHKDLKLKDRVFKCPLCSFTIDRDYNASINIRDCEKYVIV